MAKFLTFETTAVKLNDSIFPSNSVSFSLQANTSPVFDINGNLINYSPSGPIQGKFTTEFYLTGDLPSYLRFDNQSDVPISISFNNFNIPSAFLTDLSFAVEPYQPIAVSTSFDFYHGLIALDTDLNDMHNLFRPADGTNKVKNELATLNGLSSYILTSDRSTYIENPSDFIVSNFNYSFTVDRQPLLRVKQSIPSRVGLRQVNGQFGLTANNIDGLLDIHGNDAILTSVLRDPQNPNVYTSIGLTGIIIDQNYTMSDAGYGVASIKMIQNLAKKRTYISIPFGVDAPQITEVSPPVLGIWTPTTVTQIIPKKPIPPPPPPPIIYIPPVDPPPQLDADLIWFNIYVAVLRLDIGCHEKGYVSTINNIKTASTVDCIIYNTFVQKQIYYKIKFKNVQSSVVMNRNFDSEGNSVPNNYFIFSVGVNKNVLDLNLSSPGINFIEDFNEFEVIDPCYTAPLSANDPNRFLAFQAKTTTWIAKYNEYGEQDGCQVEIPPGGTIACASWKAYKNWEALITSMQQEYNNDPNRESDKNPYQIIYTIIS